MFYNMYSFPFLYRSKEYSSAWTYHSLVFHLLVGGYLNCFAFWMLWITCSGHFWWEVSFPFSWAYAPGVELLDQKLCQRLRESARTLSKPLIQGVNEHFLLTVCVSGQFRECAVESCSFYLHFSSDQWCRAFLCSSWSWACPLWTSIYSRALQILCWDNFVFLYD